MDEFAQASVDIRTNFSTVRTQDAAVGHLTGNWRRLVPPAGL